MNFKTVKHIAIAVRDLEKSKQLFTMITGATAGETIEVRDQNVRVCFINIEPVRLELISPLPDNQSLNKFLVKRGEGLHHICLGVDDIDEALADCRRQGLRLIDKIPRIGAEGHKIAFIHPASTGGVLIELEQS